MKVNSRAFVTETPQKVECVSGESINDDEPSPRNPRLSISEPLKDGMLSIERVHLFVHANKIEKIEDMKLKIAERNIIRDLFAGFDQEIKDWMIKMEEYATETELYSKFIRDYISYEFLVQKEHSFTVLILLNFTKFFKLSPETAFSEVFNISMEETFCNKCESIHEVDIRAKNIAYLKKVLTDNFSESLDDSTFDPNYVGESEGGSGTDVSEESVVLQNLSGEDNLGNPWKCQLSVNPFEESVDDVYEFNDDNLGVSVNPFTSDDNNKQFKPQKMSSLKTSKDSNHHHQCTLCEKTFSAKYNLKLHLIQVHRRKVPNITVYQCSSCDFITGSKMLYARHKETHSNIKTKRDTGAQCNICHESFANSSSLRRHKNRKH